MSEDELTARMTKMREQNEKIKQRRIVSRLYVTIKVGVAHSWTGRHRR